MSRSGVQRTQKPVDGGHGDGASGSWCRSRSRSRGWSWSWSWSRSRSNGRRSLGSRSSHKEAVLSRTNPIASTKRQKDSFELRRASPLLLPLSDPSFSRFPPARSVGLLFSCFVPAGYILVSLLFLLHRGLTVSKRRGNAAGMPDQPTACIPVQPTTPVQVPAVYEARGSILSS